MVAYFAGSSLAGFMMQTSRCTGAMIIVIVADVVAATVALRSAPHFGGHRVARERVRNHAEIAALYSF